jgi:signal transduction histidine kinase
VERKRKILIVDDAVDTVELLKKRLRFEGYDTAEAYDGESGLQKVAEYNPDLIILDIMMPKMGGYEVCQRLKSDENTKYIPIIMLTAKAEVEHKVKGLDIGADDYLAKPFNYKELSARVKSLVAIKEAREKLVEEEKAEALEQMMGEVEHEIRNPLTSIGGFARRVYEKLADGDPNKRYMAMIIKDVARLENMINQLLELKTRTVSHREVADINEIIMGAIQSFEQDFEDKGIEVNIELVDNPPSISVDTKQMEMALANLVQNAVEAMQDEPKLLKITSRITNGHVEIQVSDTGKGIAKDKIKNIFDPFFTSKIHGPGLGLALTRKIIQGHRGSISVESDPGKGTSFTIMLPVKR